MIKLEKNEFSMEELYKYAGVSRQSLHQNAERKKEFRVLERTIIDKVLKYRILHPGMGSRPLYYTMINGGEELPFGINKFEQLISKNKLTVGKSSSMYPKTSDGKGKEAYGNLTNVLIINNINQLIVADITYFDTMESRSYIFTLKDVYSQTMLSLTPSLDMTHENALACLNDMKKLRGIGVFENCIHHSDNGSQYNATAYKSKLSDMKVKISRAGNCSENGSSEQLNHIAKNMYLSRWFIKDFKQLKSDCKKLQDLNNNYRPIKQLGYLTPFEFEEKISNMSIEERPEKVMHDFNKEGFSSGLEGTK